MKARYSKHCRISEEELAWLGGRVEAQPHELAAPLRAGPLCDDQMLAVAGLPQLSVGIIYPGQEFAEAR